MKIGIIGSGNIGGNAGLHFAKAGHEVLFSSRNPEKLSHLSSEAGPKAGTGTPEDAAQFSDIIVLSVPYRAIPELAETLRGKLKDKIIIDTCNPYPGRDGAIAEVVRGNRSRRQSQLTVEQFPQSHIVKALNTIYFVHLKEYAFREPGNRIALPIAGNDVAAKQTVTRLFDQIGFDTVDIGTIADSRPMEVDDILYNKPMNSFQIKAILEQEP